MSIKFWDCLPSSTLLGLTVTVIACLIALSIYARAKHNPIANLVLIAVTIVVAALKITRTPYRTYSDGAQFVHFLLGPATVALPLRLWRSWDKFKGGTLSPLCGLAAGSLTAIVSAVGTAKLFGASHQMIASLAPRSVTTLIAMVVAEKMGGIPSLTAVLVISTGVFGAATARWVLNIVRLTRLPGTRAVVSPWRTKGPGERQPVIRERDGCCAATVIGDKRRRSVALQCDAGSRRALCHSIRRRWATGNRPCVARLVWASRRSLLS